MHLGEVNNALSQFEHECKGENEAVHERVATHILAFMVRGIFSSLMHVVQKLLPLKICDLQSDRYVLKMN